jgi:hypothetical protein
MSDPHLELLLAKYRVAFAALLAISGDSQTLTDAQLRARLATQTCVDLGDAGEAEFKQNADKWLASPIFNGVTVLDPDGWDRSNFAESWAEQITLGEFNRRLNLSTISFGNCPP